MNARTEIFLERFNQNAEVWHDMSNVKVRSHDKLITHVHKLD